MVIWNSFPQQNDHWPTIVASNWNQAPVESKRHRWAGSRSCVSSCLISDNVPVRVSLDQPAFISWEITNTQKNASHFLSHLFRGFVCYYICSLNSSYIISNTTRVTFYITQCFADHKPVNCHSMLALTKGYGLRNHAVHCESYIINQLSVRSCVCLCVRLCVGSCVCVSVRATEILYVRFLYPGEKPTLLNVCWTDECMDIQMKS
jgi:hypothetical protein